MRIFQLSESLSVTAQIAPDDVARIAAGGFRVLVNNRPDGEEADQPPARTIAELAQAAGLEYHHMPVTHADFPGRDFAGFSALLDDPAKPVLAFCRSGTRCANLWVASRPAAALDEAAQTARRIGFDLAMAERFLAQR
ncbi:MAG: TIGR01244 family sulfur transferase [Halioglobus sp.]